MKSTFAINLDDALAWHDTTREIAGIAERSGFHIRALNGRWWVWATKTDFVAITQQAEGR